MASLRQATFNLNRRQQTCLNIHVAVLNLEAVHEDVHPSKSGPTPLSILNMFKAAPALFTILIILKIPTPSQKSLLNLPVARSSLKLSGPEPSSRKPSCLLHHPQRPGKSLLALHESLEAQASNKQRGLQLLLMIAAILATRNLSSLVESLSHLLHLLNLLNLLRLPRQVPMPWMLTPLLSSNPLLPLMALPKA
jgi:hypothetical protein